MIRLPVTRPAGASGAAIGAVAAFGSGGGGGWTRWVGASGVVNFTRHAGQRSCLPAFCSGRIGSDVLQAGQATAIGNSPVSDSLEFQRSGTKRNVAPESF